MASKRRGKPGAAGIIRGQTQVASFGPDGVLIKLAALPRAPLLGFADRCAVVRHEALFDFAFFDQTAKQTVARMVAARGSLRGLLASAQQFLPSTRSWLAKVGEEPVPVTEVLPDWNHPIARPVNVIRLGRVENESEIEFYYVSISQLSHMIAAKESGPVEVVPLGRIYLPVAVTVGLLEYVKELVGDAEVPDESAQ